MAFVNSLFLAWLCIWLVNLWRSYRAFEKLSNNELDTDKIDNDGVLTGTKFSELSNRFTEIEKMPSGYEKYQQRQAVMKEIEFLIASHPKLQENLPDNIVHFRQSNS